MALKRSTARAVAASFAIVVAGATFAGAAVFHLPILGFKSRSPVNGVEQRFERPGIVRAQKRVVVRTRYVDVVVHRPSAPVAQPPAASTFPTIASGPAGTTYATTTPTAPVTPRTTEPTRTSTSAPAPTTTSTVPVLEPEHDPTDDVPPPSTGPTTTSTEPNEIGP
jgi:hypothetical protein